MKKNETFLLMFSIIKKLALVNFFPGISIVIVLKRD
jgi:hypothetical protein